MEYDSLGRKKGRRLNKVRLFLYYLNPISVSDQLTHHRIPNYKGGHRYQTLGITRYKQPSYRDVASHFHCSTRVVEKWGSSGYWYKKRKYWLQHQRGQLPQHLEYIFTQSSY